MAIGKIENTSEGLTIPFDSPIEAQSARAMLLLSGLKPENIASVVPDGDGGVAHSIGIHSSNIETEQLEKTLLLRGKSEPEFKSMHEAGVSAISLVKERAGAFGITLGDPEIRYSGNKWKIAFPITSASPEPAKITQFADSLKTGAEGVDKGNRVLIDMPVIPSYDKIKQLKSTLKPAAPASAAAMRIAIPGASAAAPYTVSEVTEGITVRFPNTDDGKSKAAAVRSLLLMSGIMPAAIGMDFYIGDGTPEGNESLIRHTFDPEVIIIGMKKNEFDPFYTEWLGDKGLVSGLIDREKAKGLELKPPMIRIRSNGKPRAVFPITSNRGGVAHQDILAKLGEQAVNASDAQVGDNAYIDIMTEAGSNALEGMKRYIKSPTLSLARH